MNIKDPMLTTLQFNDYISNQNLEGLSRLMADEHTFIDRDDNIHQPKEYVIGCWENFFKMFPNYKNTFKRVELKDDLVILVGYAYWNEDNTYDPAIWTAKIENDLITEWRIYYDNTENRKLFLLDQS
ncbi:MAG: hypothetical protein NTX22_03260 [Ignavibacteriales bacterium]|nr:hypothetical protein [Ignavibacteriales bacterium]